MSVDIVNYITKTVYPYVPEGTAKYIAEYLMQNKVKLNIKRNRSSKYGDYRPPLTPQSFHTISVNHDLNRFAFFVTLIHEFAHFEVYEKYRNTVLPHGNEWKQTFTVLLFPWIEKGIFPTDIAKALIKHLKNPKASSCSDVKLLRVLEGHNTPNAAEGIAIEQLNVETAFVYGKNRVFKLIEKRRTRYLCKEIATGKSYLFHALAKVKIVN